MYTVQIDVLDAFPLDGVTPIDFADPAVTVEQADDRFVITIPVGSAFGFFDPGEVVMLPNVPYLILTASIAAQVMPFAGPLGGISVVGPQAVGAPFSTRKTIPLLVPLVEGLALFEGQIVPFNQGLSFITDPADAGPYSIVLSIEPFRDSPGENLPSAWAAGSLAT